MSACGQTEEDSAAEEMGAPVRDIYEQKAVSKVVRVLTVLAYLLSVSLAAILLSVYYVCVWKSPELPPLNDTLERSARRADSDVDVAAAAVFYHAAHPHLEAGGSNTTVSENLTQALANITDGFSNATEGAADFGGDLADPPNTTIASFTDSTTVDISEDNGGVT